MARGTSASASVAWRGSPRSWRCSPAPRRRPSCGGSRPWRGRRACRPRPGPPAAGHDVLADRHVADVDGDDLEGGLRVQPAGEHRLGDAVRSLQHDVVRHGRANRADDALADAGDDRLFGGPADELPQVGADGDAGLDLQLDAVLRDAVERFAAEAARGAVDDLGVDARLHGLEHVAAGQVDGGRQLEIEIELRLAGGNQRADHQRHVAAGQVMGLQGPRGYAVARRRCPPAPP